MPKFRHLTAFDLKLFFFFRFDQRHNRRDFVASTHSVNVLNPASRRHRIRSRPPKKTDPVIERLPSSRVIVIRK